MRTQQLERNLVERVAMGDLLRRRARDSGSLPALVDFYHNERRTINYNELNKKVNKLANALMREGIKQSDKLAILAVNQIDVVVTYFACYKLGVIAVPINFMQSVTDVTFNLEHSGSKVVVFDPLLSDLVFASTNNNDDIRFTIQLGQDKDKATFAFESFINEQSDAEIEDRIINDRDTAHMIYTSGTTSKPKAVETSHLSLTIAALTAAIELELSAQCRMLLVLPLFHCTALSILYPTFLRSGCCTLHATFDPIQIANSLESEKIETSVLLPMMWNALMATDNFHERNLSHFKLAIYGMAPMSEQNRQQIRDAFGCKVHLGSGQTEFSPVSSLFKDGCETEFTEGNYWGVPLCSNEQAVINEEGVEVEQGETGEIVWRGPQVMNGYYKNEDASKAAYKFGWHHTGDLGFIDSKGQLMFIDRVKDTIKSGGENVSSQKVEQTLCLMKEIEAAAAIGVPHPHWGEAVCACIVGNDLTQEMLPAINAFCKEKLGKFEVPKHIFICEALPMTSTGKIRKVELREQYKSFFIQ
ncbi:class I adenylate-forming enzyme family protein [Alteromonas sp. S005]|uniref:class I adenylate-forming enzyme family protein n=1 Tax=Alteromonas sp. S005 TaxID=3117400 RepID=UPI002FDF773B